MTGVDLLTLDGDYTAEDCLLAATFSRNWVIICCYIIQLSFCIVSFASIYYLFRSKEFKRIRRLLSRDLKLLAAAGWFVYFAGVFVTAVLYSLMIISSLSQRSNCEYIWEAWHCITFRFINHYSIIGLGIFHVMLLAERLHSIQRGCDKRSWAGYLFTGLALLLPLPIILYMYRKERLIDVYKIYCFASKETISVITNITHAIGVLDVFAMVGDLFLYKYNKYLMRIKTQNYTLSKSFQLRERELSIRLIIPLSILHSVTFIPFVITYLMNSFFTGEDRLEFLEVAFLIKSFYNMVIPLAIIYLQNRKVNNNVEWLQSTENQANTYFRQLNAQFQRPPL